MQKEIKFNKSELETLITSAMNEASTFSSRDNSRGWYLPIVLSLATNEFLTPSWTKGNGYTPGFFIVCKVGMFQADENTNIEELIEIHLGNVQNNVENYFAFRNDKKVVWI
jgi:hypothetical protein